MVTRWKKWASLLALVLAVELLAAGIAGGAVALLTLSPRGYGPRDAFQENYQDTAVFRREVEDTLGYFLDAARVDPGGQSWRTAYREDSNLLYRVTAVLPASGREVVVSNTGEDLSKTIPTGYHFRLDFKDGKVTIHQDGKELDVYGDGVYMPHRLWNVPGYSNHPTQPDDLTTTISLVYIDQPIPSSVYSSVYSLYHNLNTVRTLYLADFAVLGAGVLCLALAVLWRKERREARLSLARWTGKIWFECKVLAVVVLPLFVLWGFPRNLWRFNPPAVAGAFAALYPWVLYLAANDLRHNGKTWRQGALYKIFQWSARPAVVSFYGKLWFEGKVLLLLGVPLLVYQLITNIMYWYGMTLCSLVATLLLCLCYPLLLGLALNDLRYNEKPWWNSFCCRAVRWAKNPDVLERTGKIWFEFKLLALLLPLCALPYLLGYRLYYVPQFVAAAAGCLVYLWLLYLAVNDLRQNEKPWRNSLCHSLFRRIKSGLNAAEAMLPLQRRFLWRGVAAAACVLILAALAFGTFMVWLTPLYYSGFRALVRCLSAFLLVGCLLIPAGWYSYKTRALVRELGPLAGHLAAVRAGTLVTPLAVPEGSDLAQAAEDLNGIQQGMRSALEERMKSERMKVELIANVSHDLKTPLTSVVSYAELLSEEEDLPRHVQDYIRILNAKAQRLQVMVQDVFEVSKAASGELSLRTERLDLAKLLRQTLADMDEPIEQSTLAFRAALPNQPVWITADGDRLYRVFQNLIQNALQYAMEGSRVYVALEVRDGRALASVKNTSRDELPPHTDFTARFVRGDASRSDGGGGLGLAIASSFAAACGGSFRVETDADLFTAVVAFSIEK